LETFAIKALSLSSMKERSASVSHWEKDLSTKVFRVGGQGAAVAAGGGLGGGGGGGTVIEGAE
jgi:hypothetical protein